MILSHYTIENKIDFNKNNKYSLIIENAREYHKRTKEIYLQCEGMEGNFILYDGALLNLSKKCLCIYDYIGFTVNTKKTLNLLSAEIIKNMNTNVEYFEILQKLTMLTMELNKKIKGDINVDIDYDSEINIEKYVKLIDFTYQESDTLLDNIITYIDVMSKLKDIEVVILIGGYDVLEKEELKTLFKQLDYMCINLLLIDSQDKYQFKDIEKIIIDKDLCEI